jgi:hypothetical protein
MNKEIRNTIEATYQNITKTVDLSKLESISDLKKDVYNMFKINQKDDIQILIQNLQETSRFDSLDAIYNNEANKLLIYNTHIAEIVPKQDSLKEFSLQESLTAQKYIDEIIQVDREYWVKEDSNIQTDLIPTDNQSSNTFDEIDIFNHNNGFTDVKNNLTYLELEIKNCISQAINSDLSAQIYLTNNPEFKGKLNDLIQSKLKNLTVDSQKNLKVKKEEVNKKIVENPLQNLSQNLPIFEEKCDICLRMPLIRNKYQCLFCCNFVICEECEPKHNHPCIKIKNQCVSDVNTISKLIFLSKMEIVPKSFFTKTKELIFGPTNTFQAKISVPNNINEFYVKPNTFFSLPFEVENLSEFNLPMNTYIICLNTRDLNFLMCRVEGYFTARERVSSKVECVTPNKLCTYNIRIVFFHHNVNIECDPLDIKIHVGIDEDDYLNEFFKNEENLKNLSRDQKKAVFNVISNELSTKNATQIASILMKHYWNINSAIEELVKDDSQVEKDQNIKGRNVIEDDYRENR